MSASQSANSQPNSYCPLPRIILREPRQLLWRGSLRCLQSITGQLNAGILRRKVASSLINYGERYRAGERISSCLAESTVNAVISKRFAKRQQMQWTPRGAHLLLQTRTRALDGTLRPLFERWYPGLANDNDADAEQAAA